MKAEYDFTNARRGRFFRPNARFDLPGRPPGQWLDHGGSVHALIDKETEKTLRAYRERPDLVGEHARQERDAARGGYDRLLFGLVQNSADAIIGSDGGSILVRVSGGRLYCADDGSPTGNDVVGVSSPSGLSPKRGATEVGLCLESMLGVTDRAEFFSRAGSFRFDRQRAAECIGRIASAPDYPAFRLPECVSAKDEAKRDEELAELMTWATNIVRLSLNSGVLEDLAKQVDDFPAEFLLFANHVRHLAFEAGDLLRDIHLDRFDDAIALDSGTQRSVWKLSQAPHTLADEAHTDRCAWLEAFVARVVPEQAVEASKAALKVAAAMPKPAREQALGKIVWTQAGHWVEPDPGALSLPVAGRNPEVNDRLVHAELASDPRAVGTLRELGIKGGGEEA